MHTAHILSVGEDMEKANNLSAIVWDSKIGLLQACARLGIARKSGLN